MDFGVHICVCFYLCSPINGRLLHDFEHVPKTKNRPKKPILTIGDCGDENEEEMAFYTRKKEYSPQSLGYINVSGLPRHQAKVESFVHNPKGTK